MKIKAVPYVDFIRQYKPYRAQVLEATNRVLSHGQFILGLEVEQFELSVADYLKCL